MQGTNWETMMKETMSQTCILHPPPSDSRVCIEKEVNNSHLNFSLSSHALLVLPLLEVWISEEQYGVNLREKSWFIPGSENLFVTRPFFSEGQRSTVSIPGRLVHPIFRIQ